MHISEEVKKEFAHVVAESSHIPTVCMFFTPVYVPYLLPYLDNPKAVEAISALHIPHAHMGVLVYDQVPPYVQGFARAVPMMYEQVVACITATATMCKVLRQQHNVVLSFDESGRIDAMMRRFKQAAAPAIRKYVDTKHGDSND